MVCVRWNSRDRNVCAALNLYALVMVTTRTGNHTNRTANSGSSADMDSASNTVDLAELLRSTTDELKAEFRESVAQLTSVIDQLKLSIEAKNQRISDLENQVTHVVQRNVQLAGDIGAMRNDINNVAIGLDDQEQYSRKPCLRMEGILKADGETNEILATKVVDSLNQLGANISTDDIFRLHRIGRQRTDRNGRKLPPQTIVRFTSWGARSRAYSTKFTGDDDQKKAGACFVMGDLTKRRLLLLNRARAALAKHPFAHAYADGECRLVVKNRRLDGWAYFNTNYELDCLLNELLNV